MKKTWRPGLAIFFFMLAGIGESQVAKPQEINKIKPHVFQVPCTAKIVSVECGPGLQAIVHIQASCVNGIKSYALWWTFGGNFFEKTFGYSEVIPKHIDETVTIAHSMPRDVDHCHSIGFKVRDVTNQEAKDFVLEPGCACVGHMQGVSLNLTAPNGGEQWVSGSTRTIIWVSVHPDHMNYLGPNYGVDISLVQNGTVLGYLARYVLAKPGTFSWTVGKMINGAMKPPGPGYKIRVQHSAGVLVDDSAGSFEILPQGQ
jgi:hypothetical protein